MLIVVAVMLGAPALLGQRHKDPQTGTPYESGIASSGSARVRFDIQFYMNAMLFVIFDLEVAFIVAWAVAARELGWSGYLGVVAFIAVLVAALVYEWRMGALDWVTRPTRPSRRQKGESR